MTHYQSCPIAQGKFDGPCDCDNLIPLYRPMTHDELLAELDKRIELTHELGGCHPEQHALRAIAELAGKQLDTKDMPAEEVMWYTYGYNVAMTRVYEAIEKELG